VQHRRRTRVVANGTVAVTGVVSSWSEHDAGIEAAWTAPGVTNVDDHSLFAIAFGAVILIWPGIGLLALTLVFGAFSLFYGVVTLGSVFRARSRQSKFWLLLIAAIDIPAGVAVIVWPNISALALLYAVGVMMLTFAIALGHPERLLARLGGRRPRWTAGAHA
jgi:hypothetical protein